jgi:hypothetical protein
VGRDFEEEFKLTHSTNLHYLLTNQSLLQWPKQKVDFSYAIKSGLKSRIFLIHTCSKNKSLFRQCGLRECRKKTSNYFQEKGMSRPTRSKAEKKEEEASGAKTGGWNKIFFFFFFFFFFLCASLLVLFGSISCCS